MLDPAEEASRRFYSFTNPMLLTWEDLNRTPSGTLGDDDYDDMIYLVDAIPGPPLPEPGTLALLGVALAGATLLRRRHASRT